MKKYIIILIVSLIGCTKPELPTPSPPIQKIFNASESTVVDNQTIYFDLPSNGVYTLTLVDVETGQVVSREKFTGLTGENMKKIYTKSIMSKYLYLILASEDKTQISKTKLTLN